jgi:hypothetical protein
LIAEKETLETLKAEGATTEDILAFYTILLDFGLSIFIFAHKLEFEDAHLLESK